MGDVSGFVEPEAHKSYEESEDHIKVKLSEAGLSLYQVELVFERVINKLSFANIVAKYGWTSTGSCNYHFKEALKKLRKGRFKL